MFHVVVSVMMRKMKRRMMEKMTKPKFRRKWPVLWLMKTKLMKMKVKITRFVFDMLLYCSCSEVSIRVILCLVSFGNNQSITITVCELAKKNASNYEK